MGDKVSRLERKRCMAKLPEGTRWGPTHVCEYVEPGQYYGCARRGCDRVSPAWASFGAKTGKSYCLDHIPLRTRIQLWWQECHD